MSSYVPPGHTVWQTRDYGGEGRALLLTEKSLGRFMTALFRIGGTLQSVSPPLSPVPRAWMQAVITLPAGAESRMEAEGEVVLEAAQTVGFSSATTPRRHPELRSEDE